MNVIQRHHFQSSPTRVRLSIRVYKATIIPIAIALLDRLRITGSRSSSLGCLNFKLARWANNPFSVIARLLGCPTFDLRTNKVFTVLSCLTSSTWIHCLILSLRVRFHVSSSETASASTAEANLSFFTASSVCKVLPYAWVNMSLAV